MDGQNTQHPFTDNGFQNLETAVMLFQDLGLDVNTLSTVNSLKLRNIAEFVDGFDDGYFVAQSVLRKRKNPDISPIDYLDQYINLRKNLMDIDKKRDQIKNEISFYE